MARASRGGNFERRRRQRNWLILSALAGLVVIFYVMTIVRFGGN